jgi:hypothetical protein
LLKFIWLGSFPALNRLALHALDGLVTLSLAIICLSLVFITIATANALTGEPIKLGLNVWATNFLPFIAQEKGILKVLILRSFLQLQMPMSENRMVITLTFFLYFVPIYFGAVN